MTRKKIIKFEAIETVKKPVMVNFETKDGQNISFKAVKTMKRPKKIVFYAKKSRKK